MRCLLPSVVSSFMASSLRTTLRSAFLFSFSMVEVRFPHPLWRCLARPPAQEARGAEIAKIHVVLVL